MKRFLLTLLILAMATVTVPAYAISVSLDPVRDGKTCVNNDQLVKTGAAIVYGVVMQGTVATDWIHIYDNTSVAGNPVLEIEVAVANSTESFPFTRGIKFDKGIYVDVISSAPVFVNYTILYNDD